MKESVLVTGGAGYIGSHTCKALRLAGFEPITYDNLSTGHAYAVKWGPLVQGELADKGKLLETIATYKPMAVLHFAADSQVVESVTNPAKYYRNNLLGTLTLLEAMKEKEISSLIFSSTCASYGNPQFNPITEEHPQHPINPYGRTKWMAEQMMRDFDEAYGIKSIILRYFNAAGADPNTEIGENQNPKTRLIPRVIDCALGKEGEVKVFGTQFDTRDGSAIRDYIHVSDLADAHVLALKYILAWHRSDTFNLGTGSGTSVLEVIDAVEKIGSVKLPVRYEPPRAGEPGSLTADNTKAKHILGWNPTRSTLPQIIQSAWMWQKLLLEQEPLLRSVLKEQKWSSSPIA